MKSSMASIRVIYVHRERAKVDFKSREVNCLKECALALKTQSVLVFKKGFTHRFHAIFHMPRRLTKVDIIFICFLLFYHIELYTGINKILRSCTFIALRDFIVTTFTQAGQNS